MSPRATSITCSPRPIASTPHERRPCIGSPDAETRPSARRGDLTLVPPVAQMRAAMGDRQEERTELLADPAMHAAIRKVLRARGVPREDVDDLLGEVIAEAMTNERLPLADREQDRLYLGQCARHKAIDHARARKRQSARLVSPDDDMPAPETVTMEQRLFASRLFDFSKAHFPRTHVWLSRFAVDGESQASIAQDAQVAESRVRGEISDIRRTLQRLAVVTAAAVIVLLVGMRLLRLPGGHRIGGGEEIAHSTTPPAPPVPSIAPTPSVENPDVRLAAALRDRARREVDRGDWDLAFGDLQKAYRLDSAGETPEMKSLRFEARDRFNSFDAKPHRP
jgi:DNA-directed RNA polymerase specialized sigma24 family protein